VKIIKRYPNGYEFEDDLGTRWWYWEDDQGVPRLWQYDPEDVHHEHGYRPAQEGEEPKCFISQAQEASPTPLGERPIGEVLGESGQKTYVPPDDLSDKKLSDFQPKT
jgi:hypothetical protein